MLWIPFFTAHFKPKPKPLTARIHILAEKNPLFPQELPFILPQAASSFPLQDNPPALKNSLPQKENSVQGKTWQKVIQEKIKEQKKNGLFYPPEAIAQNLEGVVEVMIFLNENGTVLTARVETSSGFPLLDEAALKVARALKTLPLGAPEEILLPILFRLE